MDFFQFIHDGTVLSNKHKYQSFVMQFIDGDLDIIILLRYHLENYYQANLA